MSSKGFIFVVANGNEGNMFGNVTYPADNISVFSIGSWNFNLNQPESYSSSGPLIQSLGRDMGIIKPNFLVIGNKLLGSDLNGNCIDKQGTSISSTIFSCLVFLFFQK